MRRFNYLLILLVIFLLQCKTPTPEKHKFEAISRVEHGNAVSVMLTAYSTTLIANGEDHTKLRVALADSLSREIKTASGPIRIYVKGDAKIKDLNGEKLPVIVDSTGAEYIPCNLEKGTCYLLFYAGTNPGRIKVEARSGNLWPGAHEIHTIPSGIVQMKPKPEQLPPTSKLIDRMIGADISWLPQFEDEGRVFLENGQPIDAIELLRKHGFNYIRLRIFVNPENEKGYSPVTAYCGMEQTLTMARRVQQAGLKLLLDFHYSDYWADPQQQYKPLVWSDLSFELLKDSVRVYTSRVLLALKKQGTSPAMVQLGNEINHGILWPEGHISQPDQLAQLLIAGVEGVENVDKELPVMMHIALGGQNDEAVFWLDNMIARGVRFDILGLSYYPRWHGTLEDLSDNVKDLIKRYNKPLNVVEYNDFRKTVHDIVFDLPDDMGKGACIWEPLSQRSGLFSRDGSVRFQIRDYDELKLKYLAP